MSYKNQSRKVIMAENNIETLPRIDRDPTFRETGSTSANLTYHGLSSASLLRIGFFVIIFWPSLSGVDDSVTVGEEEASV
mmetsp:Transcript_32887/g.53725  ORF Transcript_32887/g.53725 Transcript_32887/m.53725 type:complete len:80 (+) Transcript_32887:65-304(+)